MGRIGKLGAVALAAFTGSACLLHVDQVDNPEAAFRAAHREADQARRRGDAPHELGLLAYDRGEGELVRLELPMWLVRRACDEKGDIDLTFDGDHDRLARKLRHRWRWEDLEDAGPGVLLEVHDADERVLIWLR